MRSESIAAVAADIEANQHEGAAAAARGMEKIERTVSAINAGAASQASAGLQVAQGQARDHFDKAIRGAQEFVAFTQGNLEALVKAGQIWTSGLQDISKQVAAQAQASAGQGMEAFRALSSVKSLKEAMDLQAELARSSVQKAVAQTGQITDASMKLAGEALSPISARVAAAMESFGKAA